ncbi:hypothetical protein CDAR_382111 [Caerostris darwini]|uniref:Uncharacterized protein n=1 Tax=Caerostris darwini TaxID=1538125 RepID=A0AAV4WN69_9ARAC|nr:hypothetical protein CDAR_382111 [Caerostris darwini]
MGSPKMEVKTPIFCGDVIVFGKYGIKREFLRKRTGGFVIYGDWGQPDYVQLEERGVKMKTGGFSFSARNAGNFHYSAFLFIALSPLAHGCNSTQPPRPPPSTPLSNASKQILCWRFICMRSDFAKRNPPSGSLSSLEDMRGLFVPASWRGLKIAGIIKIYTDWRIVCAKSPLQMPRGVCSVGIC